MHIRPMKKIFLIALLISQFYSSRAQERYTYAFEKLNTIDTIYKQTLIDSLKSTSEYIKNNFFVIDWSTKDNGDFKALIKSHQGIAIIYELPFPTGLANVSNIISGSSNNAYIYATIESRSGSRGSEHTDQELYIIDVINTSYTSIEAYSFSHSWEMNDKDELLRDDYNIRNTEIIINEKNVIVLNTCFENSQKVQCENLGGEYELNDQKVRKIKTYDKETMQLKPIQYTGDVAIGMTLEDIKLIYPNVRFEEVSNKYGTCADDDTTGFEVWNEDSELMMFVIMNGKIPNRIRSIVVTSPKFNFKNINLGLTVVEVFKLYPKANFRLDSLTDWEHLFIEDLNIELVFQTQDNNRIGIYKNDDFVKLKRKNARIDYIRAD